jgi:zinc transport system permease protein
MNNFYELLTSEFFIRTVLVTGIIGLLCSLIGVFIVLRRVVFIGDGMSHAAFAGIAVGIVLGINPNVTAVVFSSLIGLLIPYFNKQFHIREDAATGIFFPAAMSIGIVLMSGTPSSSNQILSYLFGSILTINRSDVYLASAALVITLVYFYLFFKEYECIIFDNAYAKMMGINVDLFTYLLFVIMSFVIVFSIKIVGIVLISSLLVTPAATTLRYTKSFAHTLIYTSFLGVVVSEIGLLTSYVVNTPPGATICLLATVLFLISLLVTKK